MSKFDYDVFYGNGVYVAFNKEKYTKEQAIEQAKTEFEGSIEDNKLYLKDGYVRFGYGTDVDGEHRATWWLQYHKPKRGCEVWSFSADQYDFDNPEEIELAGD